MFVQLGIPTSYDNTINQRWDFKTLVNNDSFYKRLKWIENEVKLLRKISVAIEIQLLVKHNIKYIQFQNLFEKAYTH